MKFLHDRSNFDYEEGPRDRSEQEPMPPLSKGPIMKVPYKGPKEFQKDASPGLLELLNNPNYYTYMTRRGRR